MIIPHSSDRNLIEEAGSANSSNPKPTTTFLVFNSFECIIEPTRWNERGTNDQGHTEHFYVETRKHEHKQLMISRPIYL